MSMEKSLSAGRVATEPLTPVQDFGGGLAERLSIGPSMKSHRSPREARLSPRRADGDGASALSLAVSSTSFRKALLQEEAELAAAVDLAQELEVALKERAEALDDLLAAVEPAGAETGSPGTSSQGGGPDPLGQVVANTVSQFGVQSATTNLLRAFINVIKDDQQQHELGRTLVTWALHGAPEAVRRVFKDEFTKGQAKPTRGWFGSSPSATSMRACGSELSPSASLRLTGGWDQRGTFPAGAGVKRSEGDRPAEGQGSHGPPSRQLSTQSGHTTTTPSQPDVLSSGDSPSQLGREDHDADTLGRRHSSSPPQAGEGGAREAGVYQQTHKPTVIMENPYVIDGLNRPPDMTKVPFNGRVANPTISQDCPYVPPYSTPLPYGDMPMPLEHAQVGTRPHGFSQQQQSQVGMRGGDPRSTPHWAAQRPRASVQETAVKVLETPRSPSAELASGGCPESGGPASPTDGPQRECSGRQIKSSLKNRGASFGGAKLSVQVDVAHCDVFERTPQVEDSSCPTACSDTHSAQSPIESPCPFGSKEVFARRDSTGGSAPVSGSPGVSPGGERGGPRPPTPPRRSGGTQQMSPLAQIAPASPAASAPAPSPAPKAAAAEKPPAVAVTVKVTSPPAAATRSPAPKVGGKMAARKAKIFTAFLDKLENTGVASPFEPDSHEIVRDLGRGVSGMVTLVRRVSDGRLFARKTIGVDPKRCSSCSEAEHKLRRLESELEVSRLSCEHIVRTYDVWIDRKGQALMMDMDFMDGGELAEVLKARPKVPERIVARLMYHILSALAFLHMKKPDLPGSGRHIHRDLKPDNILLTWNGACKLTDFGVAKGVSSREEHHTRIGNFAFMAPECLSGMSQEYSTPADIWAAGMIAFTLVNGDYPLAGKKDVDLLDSIEHFDWQHPDGWTRPDDLSEMCFDFLSQTLARDAKARYTAEQALQDPFILQAAEVTPEDVVRWIEDVTGKTRPSQAD
eukprot:TRINITY_DN65102_c0_g1_i1.p1 TRINITY_DN65102_c0_g1~~TRINITY_DN65102_c0_g1_i1.p1  ORF type:complete len:970 (+),score=252.20 TRINITY_DN65102_c0_g1_i1:105-3014(+)